MVTSLESKSGRSTRSSRSAKPAAAKSGKRPAASRRTDHTADPAKPARPAEWMRTIQLDAFAVLIESEAQLVTGSGQVLASMPDAIFLMVSLETQYSKSAAEAYLERWNSLRADNEPKGVLVEGTATVSLPMFGGQRGRASLPNQPR